MIQLLLLFIAILLESFMPQTSASILEQIGSKEKSLESLEQFGKEASITVGEAKVLFSRLDEKVVAEQIASMQPTIKKEEKKDPQDKANVIINIDDFSKVELRVAKITECEKVKKSKKLYRLTVDLGYETRTVASGIAPYYTVEELIGKKVILVSNLAPAKLCGVESQGMLLAADAGENDVKVIFIDDSVPEGSKIH